MKRLILLILFFAISHFLLAQTQVSGNQSGIWTVTNSPYQVTGDIVVATGAVLTIEPGVEVNFQGHYKLTVHGNLQAVGTETDSILFTTDDVPSGWGGVRIDNADNMNNLSFCRIEFGKTGLGYPDNNGGGLFLNKSRATISDCLFADNRAPGDDDGFGGAVYANSIGNSVPTKFINCTFLRNHAFGEGGAIKFSNDMNTEIIGCTFIGNSCGYGGGAIEFYSSTDAKITQCLFVDNTTSSNGGAVLALGLGNTLHFENCTFTQNESTNGEGGALSLAYTTADFVNSIIYENDGLYGDDLFLSQGAEVAVTYSNLAMPGDATGNNNIEINPMFVDASNGDFHLKEASPCVDAGTDIGLPFNGEAPDMGCYESGIVSSMVLAQNKNFSFFPNPVTDCLVIESAQLFDNVQVIDLVGRIILSKDLLSTNQVELHTNDWVVGTYVVKLYVGGQLVGVEQVVKD